MKKFIAFLFLIALLLLWGFNPNWVINSLATVCYAFSLAYVLK